VGSKLSLRSILWGGGGGSSFSFSLTLRVAFSLSDCIQALALKRKANCPLGHSADKRLFSDCKVKGKPEGRKSPRAGLVYIYGYLKKQFLGYYYLYGFFGACL